MSSIIKLLPPNVANQIAAGEVVQRPSSVVKELLENSVDCGAKNIKLIIKDAGKTLIQVLDDGMGMNKNDLNMCILRHSTSKIQNSVDLFNLKSMGFRGEALSSIASICNLKIKSNQTEQRDIGCEIQVKSGKIISNNEVVCKKGTSVIVKNLFYNVPARRNFLKSNNVELKHIIDEFHRVALINSKINFIFFHNGNEIFNLKSSIFRERIIRIFGKSIDEKLVPIKESTEIAKIKGFVIKPQFSRKTRGSQFFFVNRRFIKNSHLSHAVKSAYDGLIDDTHYPSFFLCFQVPTDSIDVNIHPNKTEIKFDNDQSIYAILKSSIKHSLGQFNISPTIDFENSINLNTPYDYKDKSVSLPKIEYNRSYNPFELSDQLKIDESFTNVEILKKESSLKTIFHDYDKYVFFPVFQLNNSYIISKNSSGIVIIDQKRAHQRVLYEKFLKFFSQNKNSSQNLIFPLKLDFNKSEIMILKTLKKPLIHLGFKFKIFDSNNIVLSAFNPVFKESDIFDIFQNLIENQSSNVKKTSLSANDYMAKIFSISSCIKKGIKLEQKEQEALVNDLFACKDPNVSPLNKLIFKVISIDSIDKKIFK